MRRGMTQSNGRPTLLRALRNPCVGKPYQREPGPNRLDRLRFAVAGCQHYEHGYYTAWRGIAEEPVDFVFHYGDYIYETNEKGDNEITYLGNTYPRARRHSTPEPYSLDDYRRQLLNHPELGFSLDLSRAPAPTGFAERLAPALRQALADMAALEQGAIANPDEKRMEIGRAHD